MQKKIQTKHISDEEIFQAIRAWRANPMLPTPDISLANKYPTKVIMAKMEQMVRRGLLECGVSLRTAWIVGE